MGSPAGFNDFGVSRGAIGPGFRDDVSIRRIWGFLDFQRVARMHGFRDSGVQGFGDSGAPDFGISRRVIWMHGLPGSEIPGRCGVLRDSEIPGFWDNCSVAPRIVTCVLESCGILVFGTLLSFFA